jgi:hypothetical protein
MTARSSAAGLFPGEPGIAAMRPPFVTDSTGISQRQCTSAHSQGWKVGCNSRRCDQRRFKGRQGGLGWGALLALYRSVVQLHIQFDTAPPNAGTADIDPRAVKKL